MCNKRKCACMVAQAPRFRAVRLGSHAMITLAATTFASPQRAWLDAREQISCVGYNVLPCCIMATDSVTATCFPLASRLISDIGEARPEWRAPPFLLRRPSRVAVFVRRVCASCRPFRPSSASTQKRAFDRRADDAARNDCLGLGLMGLRETGASVSLMIIEWRPGWEGQTA